MSDLIDRQAAIDAILHITNCKSVRELFEYNQEHHLTEMWSGGVNDAIDAVIGVESATDTNVATKVGTNLAEVGTEAITKQQAIDALRKLREEDIEDYGCEIPEGFNQDHLDRATFAIKQLPPIQPKLLQPWEVLAAQSVLSQPEPHWIPVEQELPTEDDDYWATFGAETGWFVDWCSWYHGRWVVWLDDIPNDVSNVVAWCKPMEPYKGVTE